MPVSSCGALSGWSGQGRWQVLALGQNATWAFLHTWHIWQQDPQRPDQLFFTAVEDQPEPPVGTRHSASPGAPHNNPSGTETPGTPPALASALAHLWTGITPGVHRLVLDQGRVHLTLLVGPVQDTLQNLDTPVDGVLLNGFNPGASTATWDTPTLKSLARLCRPGTRLSAWGAPHSGPTTLGPLGFGVLQATDPTQPLEAVYQPHWTLRRVLRAPLFSAAQAMDVVVVGGGLSGAAVAHSLASRGWRVQVLDQAEHPSAGASGLPVGLLAPHVSPDDNPLARLTRAGVRATRARLEALLPPGDDWAPSGALEHRVEGKHGLPSGAAWPDAAQVFSQVAPPDTVARSGLPGTTPGLWHGLAAWLRPSRLVAAQLAHPNITWRGGCEVARLVPDGPLWRLEGPHGAVLAQSPTVVLATAWATRALAAGLGLALPLHALRGQVSWGPLANLPPATRMALPPFPVNGHGSLLTGAPGPDGQPCWLLGSTFERGATTPHLRPEDHTANHQRLARLLPHLADPMAPAFAQAQGWAGVRCTVPDRLPVVGTPDPHRWPGLHVCAGMGARGLTLSVLCGEVLAAHLLGEPWPVARPLAQALLAQRWLPATAPV